MEDFYDNILDKINKTIYDIEEVKKLGISKTTYHRLKKTLGKSKEVRLRRKTKGRLVK